MKQAGNVKPDEYTYNILLDGCARQCNFGRGMELLRRMEADGVRPSNYTLSVLVKLAHRGRNFEEAFKLCDELPRKYGFRPNAYVYTNLIQGCIVTGRCGRGLGVFRDMLIAGVPPQQRCYLLLVKGFLARFLASLKRLSCGAWRACGHWGPSSRHCRE